MVSYEQFADAIIRQENPWDPKSVNMRMVTRYGLWNVGHLIWAEQRGAVPVEIGGTRWAGWPTYEEARQGLIRQIRLDASRGMTLEKFIEKYAPPKYNPTEQYIRNMVAWTGIPRDGRLADYLYDGVQYAEVPRSPELDPLGLGVGDGEQPDAGDEQLAGGWSAAGLLLLTAVTATVAVAVFGD